MKRKRSQDLAIARSQKRPTKGTIGNVDSHTTATKISGARSCRLLKVLGQYGLLASIAGNLFPKDLYALATTSKSAYKAVFPCKESRTTLFAKMACAGRGVASRRLHHQNSIYFSPEKCLEYVQCQTGRNVKSFRSKPCDVCLQTTCDECRIHCVYGSIQQPAEEPDELPELSGFALLAPREMRILTPAHMGFAETIPPMPYHDQGYLDIPLECSFDAKTESIDAILDFNLGGGPLRLSEFSTARHPSPVIEAFWEITENRKRWLCRDCYEETCSQQDMTWPPHICSCTLRKAFLDRWLCVPCYKMEQKDLKETFPTSRKRCRNKCQPCGNLLRRSSPRLMCLWCWGSVIDSTLSIGELAL